MPSLALQASHTHIVNTSHSLCSVSVHMSNGDPILVRRLQRDQAAHAHASSRQVGEELVQAQAQLSEQGARLGREGERRRHLETLLDEGLQVQTQILLGLQVRCCSSPSSSIHCQAAAAFLLDILAGCHCSSSLYAVRLLLAVPLQFIHWPAWLTCTRAWSLQDPP